MQRAQIPVLAEVGVLVKSSGICDIAQMLSAVINVHASAAMAVCMVSHLRW